MKIERKYMAHYLNTAFGGSSGSDSYVRLGADLEEYSPEMSANVEKKNNILGQTSVVIDSYQKQGEVSPYYAEKDDPLFEKLQAIIDGDLTLDNLKTDIVEVKLWGEASTGAYPAVKEECYIEIVDWFAIGAGISAGIRSIDFSGIAEAVGYLIRQAFKAGVELVAGAGADMWGWLKSTFLDGFNEVFGDTDAWGPFGQNIVTGMLNGVLHVIAGIGSWIWNNIFKPFWYGISGAFDMHSPSRVAEGWGENIGIGMLNGLTLAWKKITGFIDKMKQGFSQGWQSIKSNTESVFRDLASALGGIWNGITSVIRGSVNSIISAINGMIRGVCDGLNSVIRSMNSLHFDIPDWVPGLGGKSFGFDIGTLTAPQIPYLAQGAVIPANREFLAVLGDQSHGTNVEAPLATIQQAVAEVMEDVQAGQMAGFETLAELLRQLISAVYGIELTDEQVGRAAQRWQRKQEIMMGGAF